MPLTVPQCWSPLAKCALIGQKSTTRSRRDTRKYVRLCFYLLRLPTDVAQLLDFDAARTKVRKLSDKPSDDTMKLPRVRLTYDSDLSCEAEPTSPI